MILTIATTLIYIELKELVWMKMATPHEMKIYWANWELRLLVSLSFVLQLIQVISGYFRQKYIGKKLPCVAITAWFVYLSADWVATLVLNTLLRGGRKLDNEYVAFWTPFLLWHLGSPHNITAYSLEDNDLWLRRFFGFVFQVGESVYIYTTSQSTSDFAPYAAVPILVAGAIKYGERIWALRCASDKQLVNSFFSIPDEDHKFGGVKKARTGLSKERMDDIFKNECVVPEVDFFRQTYASYNIFQPLFTDIPFRLSKEYHGNMVYMASKSAEDAFKFVDVELRLAYDLFFTKNQIRYRNRKVSLALQGFCLGSAICSLIAFTAEVGRHRYSGIDIGISYLLLVGAISLDVYGFLADAISIWAMFLVPIPQGKEHKMYARVIAFRLNRMKAKSGLKSMAQHDLIEYCVKSKTSCFSGAIRLFDTGNLLQKYGYTNWIPVDPDLKKFIYDHLKKKRDNCKDFTMDELEKLLNEKGDHALKQKLKEMTPNGIILSMDPTYFVRSIFLWHIVTGLTYYNDLDNDRVLDTHSSCKISKCLSDYMMYLTLVRPGMLCKGFADVINRAVDKETLDFLNKERTGNSGGNRKQFTSDLFQFKLNEFTTYKPPLRKVGALHEGASIAIVLQELATEMGWDVDKKWEMMSDVWMEMMTHAASHCSWREHAQQLRHGGELLTHVALIMAHFGLSTKIGIDEEEEEEDFLPPFDA